MATITKKKVLQEPQWGDSCGNKWARKFTFETNSSGYFVNSDAPATAVGAGDTVRIGVLPAGLEIHDTLQIVSNAFTATSTFDIGFAYVDGVDSSAVPQSANYFANDLATTVGVTRKTAATAPVILPKDAYLTILNNTAAQAEAGVIDIVIDGIWTGIPS